MSITRAPSLYPFANPILYLYIRQHSNSISLPCQLFCFISLNSCKQQAAEAEGEEATEEVVEEAEEVMEEAAEADTVMEEAEAEEEAME